ncbi:MAG TPA: hypothetical protein VHM89_05480 [Acidimicrobiales bacterium]|nr:hypothetical protein [Acidimicrobiales bacterium]
MARIGARPAAQHRPSPLEQPPFGVVVHERQGPVIGVERLVRATEAVQQLGSGRVQVAVAVQRQLVDDAQAGRRALASATATARFSWTTGESVRPASSP